MEIIDDDAIGMSELEELANKKKMLDEPILEVVNEEIIENPNILQSKHSSKSSSSSIDSSSISSISTNYSQKKKKGTKENKNESIKREKLELLYKLSNVIAKSNGRFSLNVTIENTLQEIQLEFTRIKTIIDNESMLKFCKHGLVMGIKGIEMLNSNYDPFGIDLDGWGESMSYNMATNEYDDVLLELCEKYKGVGKISPELKLILMILMSGVMFSFTKRATKDPTHLMSMLNSLRSKQNENKSKPQESPVPSPVSSKNNSPINSPDIQPPRFEPTDITNIMEKIRNNTNHQEKIIIENIKPKRGRPKKNPV